MYGWNDDRSTWKKPDAYKFDSARAPYLDKLAADGAKKGPRTYTRPAGPDMALVDPKNKVITTESENPIVFLVDGTGSMVGWPAEFFDRAPLLYKTLSQYRPDVEIAFGVIGDANSDRYPYQINNFGKGVTLDDHIKALFPEGNGGGQISESYELAAYHILNNCQTPKAKAPFLFVFGDEKFYESVSQEQAEHYLGTKLQGDVSSKDVWKALNQKFNLFYLQKPYGHGNESDITRDVKQYWTDAIGVQRVIDIPSADRAVDVAMAIVARYWGQFSDFKDNMSARQDDATVAGVVKSIRYIPAADPAASGKSLVVGPDGKTDGRYDSESKARMSKRLDKD